MIKLKNIIEQQKDFTLRDINREAKKYDLELVKGRGYYYWWGLSNKMKLITAGLYSTSVSVYNLNDLSYKQWMDELMDIVNKIKNH